MQRFKLKEGITIQDQDGEGIIVDTNTGRYLTSNETGLIIITAMNESQTDDEFFGKVLSQIEVERAVIEEDIGAFMQQLQEMEMIDLC